MPRDQYSDGVLAEPDTVGADAQGRAPGRSRGSRLRRGALLIVPIAALSLGGWTGWDWWTVGRHLVSTDDAYVEADFAVLAPRVSGYVTEVAARENADAAAGALLVRLDAGDYETARDAAEAALSAKRAAATRAGREVDAAEAAVAQAMARRAAAEAARAQTGADFDRYAELARQDFASGQRLDAARAARATAGAGVAEAEAGLDSARAAVAVARARAQEAKAAVAQGEAALRKAERDLAATVIRAPFDGVVGNLSVAVGDYVMPGSRMLAVVPLGAVYVDANFKETQIGRLAPGARVRIVADAYPDRPILGHVDSLAPASGAMFSLLPPENATGNFTKVVQRVPVRIAVPPEIAAEGWLRPGLSVRVTADPEGVATDGVLGGVRAGAR